MSAALIGFLNVLAAATPASAWPQTPPPPMVDPWSGDGVPTLPVTRSPVHSTMDISGLLRDEWPEAALSYARAIHRLRASLDAREGLTLNLTSPALLRSAGLHDSTALAALRDLAGRRRLSIDGAAQWVAPDARLITGESLVRQHLYAFRYWVDDWRAWPENAASPQPTPRPASAGPGITFRAAPVERMLENPDSLADASHPARFTNRGDLKTLHRQAEAALLSAEAIGTLASLWGMTYPTGDMDEAFRSLLFCQQHDTLGGVCLPGNYDYVKMLLRGAQDRAAWAQSAAMRHLAERVAHPGGDFAVLVANPLGFRRTTWVAIDAEPGSSRQSRYVVTRSDGREVNYQIVRMRDGDQMQIVAEDVPAYGYDTYRVTRLEPATQFTPHAPPKNADQVTARVEPDGIRIENNLVRVMLDKHDAQIISYFDKRSAREVLTGGRKGNVLELHLENQADATIDRFGTTSAVETISSREDTTVTDQGPLVGRVRVTRRWGDSVIEQLLTLHAGSPRLDVETYYFWREPVRGSDPAPIVRVAFPAAEGAGLQARFGAPYGEIVVGADGAERAGLTYAAITGATGGAALLTSDRHGFSASADGTLRLTLLRTLFQPMNRSQFVASRLHYAVLPIAAGTNAAELAAAANDYLMPLVGRRIEAPVPGAAARAMPGRFEALDTSTLAAGAQVVCFKRAHDGEGYIVRAVAPAAMTSGGAIRPGFPVKHAEISSCLEWWKRDELAFSGGAPADLLGKNIFDANQGLIPLVMKNSRILTVRVLRGEEPKAGAPAAEPARPDAQ